MRHSFFSSASLAVLSILLLAGSAPSAVAHPATAKAVAQPASALSNTQAKTQEAEQPAITYRTIDNVSYLNKEALAAADTYRAEQCRMDLYLPQNEPEFPTIVWFHGGGLTGGKRYLPRLQEQGYALVAVSYRLSPQAPLPAFLEDAAAATAWVIENIASYGGDPQKVFVAGHSAGGYLAAMIGMDASWLAAHGVDNRQLAGVVPVSAQITTHFHIKKLQGDTGEPLRPLIDKYAPFYHSSKDLPPICLITGDRKIEWQSRVEENQLLEATLRNLGHPLIEFHEIAGKNHGTVVAASWELFPPFIDKAIAHRKAQQAAAESGGGQ